MGRHWYASGAHYKPQPESGDLIAHNHAVWRVISIETCPEEKRGDHHREQVMMYGDSYVPVIVVLRPPQISSDDIHARDHDKHFRVSGACHWQVYPNEHYPICGTCHEPLPCREREGEKLAHQEIQKMGRYETPGICPACEEVVTKRQQSLTFSENLELPGGPPVTFHLRGQCHYKAGEYEKQWVAAEPSRRRVTLTCPGTLTNHSDNTFDCTEMDECPGARARHDSMTICRCPECFARTGGQGWSCCPRPTDIRNGSV